MKKGQFISPEEIARSNALFGYEGDKYYFDVDIRRCNNLCPFCFVLQTAPRMRRALYIKDDDYQDTLS